MTHSIIVALALIAGSVTEVRASASMPPRNDDSQRASQLKFGPLNLPGNHTVPGITLHPFSRSPSISGCSPRKLALIAQIDTAIGGHLNRLTAAIPTRNFAYVRDNFLIPRRRVYSANDRASFIYSNYLQDMTRVFQTMKSNYDAGVTYTCRDDYEEAECREGEVQAYVMHNVFGHSYKVINLCTNFFARARTNLADQTATVFHELSHYAIDTEDYALDWMNGTDSDFKRATNDAYHIQEFASYDLDSVLRRTVWQWNWSRSYPADE